MPLQEIRFSDLDFAFIVHPVSKQLNISKENQAVINSVRNIILTNQFERAYKPTLGANLSRYLFENFDSIVEHNIRKDIETAIENFEPRVEIQNIKIFNESYPDQHKLRITIVFFILNQPDPISLTLFVERTK